MPNVKSGSAGGGYSIIDSHVQQSDMELGAHSRKMAEAKASGGGWGALIGGLIGFMIGGPAGAVIGGGIGGVGGSRLGEEWSGVKASDISGGSYDFRQQTRSDILGQLGDMDTSALISGAISGLTNVGAYGAFKAGTMGGGNLLSKAWGGFKGAANYMNPLTSNTLVGQTGSVSPGAHGAMKVGGEWIGSGAPGMPGAGGIGSVAGGVGKAGIGKIMGGIGDVAKSAYGGADALLGGVLPYGKALGGADTSYGVIDQALGGILPRGQDVGEGYLSRGVDAIGGLLGPKTDGSKEYKANIKKNFEGKNLVHKNVQNILKTKLPSLNPFAGNIDAKGDLKQFQIQYNQMGYGPKIKEDGEWGPESMDAYRLYQGMMGNN